MDATDEILAWVVLTRAPGLTTARLGVALQAAGGAARLLSLRREELARAGLPQSACAFLQSSAARATRSELRWLDKPRHRILCFVDPDFPILLNAVANCPIALYVDGDASQLRDPQLAIVGSRNPTPPGRDNAFDFAHSLSIYGLTITSGLAEGIDTAAHRGALAADGPTLAILGTGVDRVYPAENAGLAREIAHRGALVSSFPLGTSARSGNFPRRNRLIAGLSLGTLVVEAAPRSGSLSTARLAALAQRSVFALPGSIHNPLAHGCHDLIRRGAYLTEKPDDILKQLNFLSGFAPGLPTGDTATPPSEHELPMDKGHKILLDALGFDPADLDVLGVRTGLKPETVSAMMLILELEGHVKRTQGGCYIRVARSPLGER